MHVLVAGAAVGSLRQWFVLRHGGDGTWWLPWCVLADNAKEMQVLPWLFFVAVDSLGFCWCCHGYGNTAAFSLQVAAMDSGNKTRVVSA